MKATIEVTEMPSPADRASTRLERWRAFAATSALLRNDRFLSPRMLLAIGVYLFVALSYVEVRVNNDGFVYYDFMRRLVGDADAGYAYQFGSIVWNLPFYLLAKAGSGLLGRDTVAGIPLSELSVAIASNVAVLVIFYLCWTLIRELGLPGGPGAILLTVFGTPLFYYAIFQPSYKQVADTLAITLLALLLLRATTATPSTRMCVAIGAVLAVSINIRYANAVLLVGVLYVFLRGRQAREAYVVSLVAVLGAAVVLAIPYARGIPYGASASEPAAGAPAVQTDGTTVPSRDIVWGLDFDPLAPAKMLVTVKRGLFVWTPLTIFGVAGYVLLLIRDPQHRRFLTGLGLSALALLLVHSAWGALWTGGYSFSQRFLTGLFPLFAIGIAAVLRQTRMLIAPVLVACVAFSLFLSLYHFYGYDDVTEKDGADRILELFGAANEETVGEFLDVRVEQRIRDRWSSYADWAKP